MQPGGYTQIDTNTFAGAQFGVNELERDNVDRELAGQGFRIDYGWITARHGPAHLPDAESP